MLRIHEVVGLTGVEVFVLVEENHDGEHIPKKLLRFEKKVEEKYWDDGGNHQHEEVEYYSDHVGWWYKKDSFDCVARMPLMHPLCPY